MMPTGQVFVRMIGYGLVLSAIDAVAGRALQAAPDPSMVLPLGATAWAAYRLAEGRQNRIAFPAGILLWLAFVAGFLTWTRLLVGWNGSVPWHPRSTAWMLIFAISAPIAAVIGQVAGSRAATRGATNASGGATP